MFFTVYSWLLAPLFIFGFKIFSLFNRKANQGLQKRKESFEELKKFAKNLNPTDVVYFFHSSSVGEWEQCVPLIESIKHQTPKAKFIATFFSYSGYNHVNNSLIDCKIMLRRYPG
ncbi:MAG: glycosyltransferase N-terminal domain-containing protein, partial [Bacteroidales bacterium]